MSKSVSLSNRAKKLIEGPKFWFILSFVYIIARLPTWFFPFDSDHWIFYYVGRKWLDGAVLYLQVWDHKSPLIFAINGGMHALFGDNLLLHRTFLTGVSVLSVWLFYLVVSRLLKIVYGKNSTLSTRIATLVFAFWANLSQFTNSGNNTENFGVVALLAAVLFYLKWKEVKHWKWLLYSGVGISALVFLKINFCILLLPLIIDFIVTLRKDWKKILSLGAVWIAPLLAQGLLWYSYFAPRGLLGDWWIAMVTFNSKYLRAGWAGNLSGQFIFLAILGVAALFFVGCYVYLFQDTRKKRANPLIITIGGSALLFSVILGTFYTHYYLIVIPYFCTVFALYWRQVKHSRLFLVLAVIGAVGSLGISYRQLYNNFYGPTADDFAAMESAASAVNAKTTDKDKIFFYGYGATFYQLADRDSGSRFISASHLLIDEREGFGFGFTDKFIGDMQVSGAKYVIIDPATINIYSENEKAMDYINNRYELELVVNDYQLLRRK